MAMVGVDDGSLQVDSKNLVCKSCSTFIR